MRKRRKVYKNDFEELLAYGMERNYKGKGSYDIQVVLKGLVQYKIFRQMELGEKPIERFLLDRIFYRVGLDPAHIETIIVEDDYQYYIARRQIYDDYYNEAYEEAWEKLVTYEKETSEQLTIHHQFVLVMRAKIMMKREADGDCILKILQEALDDTAIGWKQWDPVEICLAPDELEIILLMAECHLRKKRAKKAKKYIEWVIQYFKKHQIEKEVWSRFLPLAYLEYSKIYRETIALQYVKTGILLCYQAESLFYLFLLQQQYIHLMNQLEKKEGVTKYQRRCRRKIENERQVILELCEEAAIDWKRIEPTQTYSNTYLLSELLKRHREYLGEYKKDFAAEICTENAYSAIENGSSVPRKKFPALMQKIGFPINYVITPLHGVKKEYMNQKLKINALFDRYLYEDAEVLCKILETKMKEMIDYYPRNKQFFIRTNAIFKAILYKQPRDKQIRELEHALRLTIPEYPEKDLSKRVLLKQEVYILNSMAVLYSEEENYEKAVEIWKSIKKSYQTSKLYGWANYDGYNKIQTNYVSCIGSNGEYDRSTEMAHKIIKKFLKRGTLKYLARLCYGIAWDKQEKMKLKYGKVKKEAACQKKLRQAAVLAEITNNIVLKEFFHKKSLLNIFFEL